MTTQCSVCIGEKGVNPKLTICHKHYRMLAQFERALHSEQYRQKAWTGARFKVAA